MTLSLVQPHSTAQHDQSALAEPNRLWRCENIREKDACKDDYREAIRNAEAAVVGGSKRQYCTSLTTWRYLRSEKLELRVLRDLSKPARLARRNPAVCLTLDKKAVEQYETSRQLVALHAATLAAHWMLSSSLLCPLPESRSHSAASNLATR